MFKKESTQKKEMNASLEKLQQEYSALDLIEFLKCRESHQLLCVIGKKRLDERWRSLEPPLSPLPTIQLQLTNSDTNNIL